MSHGLDADVAVVIPCRGHAELLHACLESVVAQEPAACEIVVVDSDRDPCVAEIARRFAGVRLVRGEGLTAGTARNAGVARTHAARLAFLDADAVANPGWLAAAVDALDAGAAAVGGPVADAPPG